MKHTGIRVTGIKLKDGKLLKSNKSLSVSAKIRQSKSKKTRVMRKGQCR